MTLPTIPTSSTRGSSAPGTRSTVATVVVPAHDEAENLARLVSELGAALPDPRRLAAIVVVDDGSTDGTPTLLRDLARAEPRLHTSRHPTRRGQTAALLTGFRLATTPLVATLDADLQCHPRDLPALLDALGGADMAAGVRRERHDPATRRLASALANRARRLVLAPVLEDLACPLRVMRRAALVRLEAEGMLFDGAHRWLPALFQLAGFRVVQRPVPHHPRCAGTSKYTTRGRVLPIARELARVLAFAAARAVRPSPAVAQPPPAREA
ncbi:MAG TPA: glycosyltransferase family 2 protein [Candidatus Binatia bacterium]|nr:glycosyltransferase family 2 protein [Candidatus Binatia bacterium]